jgi:integrase/recombinase XerD
MLTLYRRHKDTCPEFAKGRGSHNRCKCAVWADGILAGKETRRSLKTRDWTKANKTVQQWEAQEKITESTAAVTLADAWKALLADLPTRVGTETVRKYKTLKSQMTEWADARGLTLLSQFDLDTLSQFRQTWKDSPRTASKKVERLRSLFAFALDRKWIQENPARAIKLPKLSICPTLPLTSCDMLKILTACDDLAITAQPSGRLGAHRLKSLLLLMRYSGMRVSDAVAFNTDRLDGKRLFLYTAKTGTPVYTVLPDSILAALDATPRVTEKNYFWTGNGKRETAVCDYQEKIKKVFDLAGISKGLGNAVSHRFRDTFAVELLLAGVPIERVSVLLGHQSVRVTEKHYNPWVRSRQEQLEADVRNAWKTDALLTEQKLPGTIQGQFSSKVVN